MLVDITNTLKQAGYHDCDLEWLPDRIFDAILKEPDELNDDDLIYLIQYRKARNGHEGPDD